MKYTMSIIFLSFVMAGCGGGGGGSSGSGASSSPQVAPDQSQFFVTDIRLKESAPFIPLEPDDIIESLAKSSREIVVPDNFNLNSERILDLRVTRSQEDMQSAYLSLCTDYVRDAEGGHIINYDSCLLRATLSDNEYETTITITNDLEGLVAALWFVDANKAPITMDWRFDN